MFLKLYQILVFLVWLNVVYSDICTNTSVRCDCKEYTNIQTHLPTFFADCSSRFLTELPENINEDLNVIDFSINAIETLDPNKRLLDSEDLEELIFGYNNITHVDVDFFQNLPNLKKLDLSNNFIDSFENPVIFEKVPHLVRLDISFNNFKSLPDFIFNPLVKLTHLDISYNFMGAYLTQSKTVLREMLCLTPNLTHLHMNGLGIRELPAGYFDGFDNLKELSLADNEFTLIPTVPYSVEQLDLSGNKLSFVSANYLNYHSLKVLKLNRMPTLTTIPHYAFYNLFALEKLFINDCPNLKEFSELAFDVVSKDIDHHIKVLSLARNGLNSLNETYKYLFRKMEHVDLTHNPWVCDCDILWLQNFALEFYRSHEIRCHYPPDLRLKKILELQPSDVKECYPAIFGKKSHRVLIVVLSIAVVVLCGLILYLLRYPIKGLSSKHRISPNSPYGLTSTEEQE